MLLRDKMKKIHFSNNETIIINYILEKGERIQDYSTKQIAKETYTSPSSLIRIAKKLGYDGWNQLKKEFIEETEYLNRHFKTIDPNFPFNDQNNIISIANTLTQLYQESALDTMSLIHHDSLQQATLLLNKSTKIHVFSVGNLVYAGEELVFKLNRIHKEATLSIVQDNMFHDALMMTPNECALCISYSGETPTLLKTVRFLKQNQVPIIAITSIGDNCLSQNANVTLNITTREKSYSKIAGFSSLTSIHLILDILFSCLFSLDYQNNLNYKLQIANRVENDRLIHNDILFEKD